MNIELSKATTPFFGDIYLEEVLFISDTEGFDDVVRKQIYSEIEAKRSKLVVFLGDILSFLTNYSDAFSFVKKPEAAFETFFDLKKIKQDYKKDNFYVAYEKVGSHISEYMDRKSRENKFVNESIRNYLYFLEYCKKKNVVILFYSGNHDFLLSGDNIVLYSYHIPFLRRLYDYYPTLTVPTRDLQLIKLNKDLYICGIHTHEDVSGPCNVYPAIEYFVNSVQYIEHPEKIILVSHIPGVERFSNVGSKEITLLEKKFKFKYHYHGHCKDYHGEYIEEGVPTRSVHFKECT